MSLYTLRPLLILLLISVVLVSVGAWHTYKPLPVGIGKAGRVHNIPSNSVSFLADRTYVDSSGTRHSDQEIFDAVLDMISRAERYILIDMFLYNDFQGNPPETTRALANEVTAALVNKKKQRPEMQITVVSDPINVVYGGVEAPQLVALAEAGIDVGITNLKPLRDSNPIYSALWRSFVQWFGNSKDGGLVPHPFQFEGPGVTARSWLSLLNFKANHRKLIVADDPQSDGAVKLVTLVTSANPHDGSSAHTNTAFLVRDGVWQDAVATEQAVGDFSGIDITDVKFPVADDIGDTVTVQLLTDGAIRDTAVRTIDETHSGDAIDMAMFYLAERSVIDSLVAASERGVAIRLALDPNKDAFGRVKNGVPNRPVAHELLARTNGSIDIRWCDTHGEQCHTKMLIVQRGENRAVLLGSANLTRRNIADLNLETNVLITGPTTVPALAAAEDFFNEIWGNRDGKTFTVSYDAYAEDSLGKTLLYRFQEATGLSSF